MHPRVRTVALALVLAALAACSSTPAGSGKLAAAKAAIQKADDQGEFSGAARTDLDAARHHLQEAEDKSRKGAPRSEVDNLAYAAEQLATAAMARKESTLLQDKEARDREAKMALHRAETAEMEAERVRQLAEAPK